MHDCFSPDGRFTDGICTDYTYRRHISIPEAKKRFRDAKLAFNDIDIDITGFVSPWHDNLDEHILTISNYFKYAVHSCHSYDKYNLSYYEPSKHTFEEAKQAIDDAVTNKKLLILVFHKVVNDTYTMEKFKNLCDYIKTLTDTDVAEVTTLRKLYA